MASANAQIGLGHVFRCLSIADALRARGRICLFMTDSPDAVPLIERRSHQAQLVPPAEGFAETFLPALKQALKGFPAKLLFVDSYQAGAAFLEQARALCPIAYLDDFGREALPVDFLINYHLYADEDRYRALYAGQMTVFLLGPRYAPLRAEFQNPPPKSISAEVRDVLISTGGADPWHVGLSLLRRIPGKAPFASWRFHLVVGPLNADREQIREQCRAMAQVQIHQDVQCMSGLMQQMDLALAASGSTLYELCACGLPTLAYTFADNQLALASSFAKAGLVVSAGDCRQDEEAFWQGLWQGMEALAEDEARRARMSTLQRQTVDGLGADRIGERVDMLKE